MPQLVKIHNPFDRTAKDISQFEVQGQSLADIVKASEMPESSVSVNGVLIDPDDWNSYVIRQGDYILMIPKFQGASDSSKRTIGMVAMIVVSIASMGAGSYVAGAAWGGKAAGAIVTALISTAGGLIINAMMPGPTNNDNIDKNHTQAYGWNPATAQQSGLSIPYYYGVNRVRGNVVAAHTEPTGEDNKQVLSAIIALGRGPIKSIDNININDQPVGSYDGVEIVEQTGTLGQSGFKAVNKTKTEYAMGNRLRYNQPVIVDIPDTGFDEFEVDLTLPAGLYQPSGKVDGGLSSDSVYASIFYREKGTSSWLKMAFYNNEYQIPVDENTEVSAITITDIRLEDIVYLDEYYSSTNNQAIRIECETNHNTLAGNYIYIDGVTGSTGATQLNGTTHRVLAETWTRNPLGEWTPSPSVTSKTLVIAKVHGFSTSDYVSGGTILPVGAKIKDTKLNNVRRTYGPAYVDSTKTYELKCEKLNPDKSDTDPNYGDDLYLGTVRTSINQSFRYPRLAAVGIKALATEDLSGGLDFSCVIEGRYVRVYDGTDWGVTYSNNPAWVLYDILTQPVFSGKTPYEPGETLPATAFTVERYDGFDPQFLDSDSFLALANYCDETVYNGQKRITFNGGFDVNTTLWDAALKICEVGRCILVRRGTRYSVVIDKASDPVALFTVGNTGKDSFTEIYIPKVDRASEIEIHYRDAELDYERVPFTVVDPDSPNTNNKISIELFGITNQDEAWRHGMLLLNKNRLIDSMVEFTADVDAVACTLGDVIRIQQDVPLWGEGGRIVEASGTSVTLDREVFDTGGVHELMVRLGTEIESSDGGLTGTDKVETRTVTNIDGRVVTLSTAFSSDPVRGDLYAFGESGQSTRLVRITEMERDSDQKVKITAIEYVPEIYADDTSEPQLIDIEPIAKLDPSVTNLYATERVELTSTGSEKRYVEVGWNLPHASVWSHAEILVQPDGLTSWEKVGESPIDRFYWYNPTINTSYTIAVATVDALGRRQSLTDAAKTTITVGESVPYASNTNTYSVTGLTLENAPLENQFVGKDAKFTWNEASVIDSNTPAGEEVGGAGSTQPDIWFRDYEVTILDESGNERRVDYVTSPNYIYSYEKNWEDGGGVPTRNFTISVKVRDVYYNLSATPAKLTVENPAPEEIDNLTAAAYVDAIVLQWDGVDDLDFEGYVIHVGDTAEFTPSDVTLLYKGNVTGFVYHCTDYTEQFFKVAAYDAFGLAGLNYASTSETPNTPITGELTDYDLDAPFLSGVTWSADTTSYSWTAGTMVYGSQDITVSAGNYNTSAYTSDDYPVYVWADLSGTIANPLSFTIAKGNANKPIIGGDKWLFAIVDKIDANNVIFPAWQQRIMHAGLMQARTITADLIGTQQIKAEHLEAAEIITYSIHVAGGPPVNATNGATWGSNITDQPSDAQIITSQGTAAAITDQGTLATKSSVDLATGEVTNKSLANLDSAANTIVTTAGNALGTVSANVYYHIVGAAATLTGKAAGLYGTSQYLGFWSGTAFTSYIDSSGNAVFKNSLTIGDYDGSGKGLQILAATGTGDVTLLAKNIDSSGYYTETLIGTGGIQVYAKNSGGWPGQSSSYITVDISTGKNVSEFSTLRAGRGPGFAGTTLLEVTTSTGFFGRGANKITYDASSTSVPAAGLTGTIDNARLPVLINFGFYTGEDDASKTITHGLSSTPTKIVVHSTTDSGGALIWEGSGDDDSSSGVSNVGATTFQVNGNADADLNNAENYFWIASCL